MTAIHFFAVTKFLMESKILESSSKELLQNVYDLRLQFFQHCAQYVAPEGITVNHEELKEQILEKYALHHHMLQDKKIMMKLVRAFSSLESKRAFLKKLNCIDELLLLELELDNFIEAVSIAKEKGDFVLEVDLLQKAGHFKDAAILILGHVLGNSLWTSQSKGWPLKQFKQKEDLLNKAKSLAIKESDLFYTFVCTEADVLADQESSLSKMEELFNASQRNNCIVAQILSARKILDVHLISDTLKYEWDDDLVVDPKMLCADRISIRTLVYFWNFWRDKIADVFEYLRCYKTQDGSGYSSYENFCLSYLSVRKSSDDKNNLVFLVDPCADWVSGIDVGSEIRLNTHQFVAAAHSYWSSEVLSIGIKVLEMLSSLHTFSLWNSFSLFRQSTAVLHVFDVTKFLRDAEFLERSHHDRILKSFFGLSIRSVFENLLDRSNLITENMMILRMSQRFRNAIEGIVLEEINSGHELTFGEIGRVIMVILASGKLSAAVYDMVEERFIANPSWKAFIRNFKGVMGSKSADNSLVLDLHEALSDTFKVDWRREFEHMSPNCFLYIIDRFLLLESFNQEVVFTTKSSFIEWFICQESHTSTSTMSVMKSTGSGAFDFLVSIVNQLLVNKFNTMEWLKRSNLDLKYYQVVVLRLMVVICLVCLNSEKYFDALQNLIDNDDIISQLPLEFSTFPQGRQELNFGVLVNIFGKALMKIGDPLLIVSLKNGNKFFSPEAISISGDEIQNQDVLLKKLFVEDSIIEDHGCAVESEMFKSVQAGTDGVASEVDFLKSFRSSTNQSCKGPCSSASVSFMDDDDEFKNSVESGFSTCELENISTAINGLHSGSPKPNTHSDDTIKQIDIVESTSSIWVCCPEKGE